MLERREVALRELVERLEGSGVNVDVDGPWVAVASGDVRAMIALARDVAKSQRYGRLLVRTYLETGEGAEAIAAMLSRLLDAGSGDVDPATAST